MQGLTICIIAIIALTVCIFIGQKIKCNIGVLALIAASILGVFVFGLRPSALYGF